MIFFRAPEFWSRLDLRHDRTIEFPAFANLSLRRFGRGFLFWRMIENRRAILRARIGTLSIQRCRIVVRPENVEELIVTNLSRIEFQLNHLGVSGLIAADIFVSWVFLFATRVAHGGRGNTFQVAEHFLHAPKATCTERRFFHHPKIIGRPRASRNRG